MSQMCVWVSAHACVRMRAHFSKFKSIWATICCNFTVFYLLVCVLSLLCLLLTVFPVLTSQRQHIVVLSCILIAVFSHLKWLTTLFSLPADCVFLQFDPSLHPQAIKKKKRTNIHINHLLHIITQH